MSLISHTATSHAQAKLDRLYGDSREHASFALSLLADRRRAAAPRKLLAKLRAAVSRQSWASSPLTINAYYSAVMNKIILPLGILQHPFYSADRPEVSQMIC